MDEIEIDDAEHYAKSAGGLFDIRNVIGAMFGVYGIILVIAYAQQSAADQAKAGSVNLWIGVGMLAAAVVFIGWALLRPVRVEHQ